MQHVRFRYEARVVMLSVEKVTGGLTFELSSKHSSVPFRYRGFWAITQGSGPGAVDSGSGETDVSVRYATKISTGTLTER